MRWSELKLQYRSERSLASGQLEGSERPPRKLDVPVIEDKFLGSVRLQPVQAVKLNEFLGALATGDAYRCAENDGVVDDAHSNPAAGRLGRSSAGAKLSHAGCHGSAVARGFPAEIAVPAIMAIRVRSQPNAYSDGFARHQFMQSCHHRRAILEFCPFSNS